MDRPKLTIICTHGASRCGKGTLIRELHSRISRLNIPVACIDFADPLRNVTMQLLGCNARTLEDSTYRATPQGLLDGKNPADFMRLLGTEFVRELISQDFWRTIWCRRITGWEQTKRVLHTNRFILVSDARFADELDTIYALHDIYDVTIHHVLIHRESATFSDHRSDFMNKHWLLEKVPPTGAIAINAENISYMDNSYSLEDFSVLTAQWIDKLLLTVLPE